MTFLVVARKATATNRALVTALQRLGVEAELVRPERARRRIRAQDVALGRVDVLPTLDGVEACLWELRRLERHGARVLNGVGALLATHDKLATALRLGRAGLPHPRTVHLDVGVQPALEPPLVLKPRFGSWGRDVVLCETQVELEAALGRLRRRRWFARHGVLAQELIPPRGRDLRLVVAGGRVVGAVERQAAPGEWRTNVALGAVRLPVDPPAEAARLAVAAAEAVDGDLVGVDVLQDADGRHVVLELNGAVDFTPEYAPGRDVFADAAAALLERAALPARELVAVTA